MRGMEEAQGSPCDFSPFRMGEEVDRKVEKSV